MPLHPDEHPLDEALGNVHEAAIALAYHSRNVSPGMRLVLSSIALSLGHAHEALQSHVVTIELENEELRKADYAPAS